MPDELTILAAVIDANDAPWPSGVARIMQSAPDSFDDQQAGQIASIVRAMRAKGAPINFVIIGKNHPQFLDFITRELAPAALGLEIAESFAPECWNAYLVRQTKNLLGEGQQSLEAAPRQAPAIINSIRTGLEAITSASNTLGDKLATRLYSHTANLEQPAPRYSIAGIGICTQDNITTISAQAKAGKSSAIGAMIASTFARPGADCLGFTSENPRGLAVLHLDTEQSPFDHWEGIQKALRRAGATEPPPWLLSYRLAGITAAEARQAVQIAAENAAKQFGGVHSILIDGTADIARDVNDPAEANDLVAELHGMAIKYHCPILNIIHLNPGKSDKTRGHLGSQLERKSETNLRLEKDESGVTVIFADKNRRASITKSTGPRFAWCKSAGMHTSIESRQSSKEAADIQDMQREAEAVFSAAGKSIVSYGQFISFLISEVHASKSTAKRRLGQMLRTGVITKELTGFYALTQK